MGNSKRKQKNFIPENNKMKNVSNLLNKDHTISADEYKEYQALLKAKNENGDFDFETYKNELVNSLNAEIDEEKKKKLKEIDEITTTDNEELMKKNQELKEEKSRVEKEVENLSSKRAKIDGEVKEILDAAEKKAEKITADADIKAKKITEKAKKDADEKLKTREDALNDAEDKLDVEKNDLEREKQGLERKLTRIELQKKRLDEKEQEFNDSNPAALEKLRYEISSKENQIADILNDYKKLSDKHKEMMLLKISVGDKTAEELYSENKQMQEKIEELTEKCNRFSEFELSEMQKALDEKPHLEEEISQLKNALREENEKKYRLENAEKELENIRARIDLINTLNNHLARELQNSKKALESRDGSSCPQLMEEDREAETEKVLNKYEERKQYAENIRNFTLPEIVQHVKDYAETKSLYYKDNDLRAFVAGLASSRTAVLQGISGTGKTTLPRIFAEALLAENHRVEVQSSWRDRNELIGYYNDFNKKFTARKFTSYLYRAGLKQYKDTPFFIVLDEMNLSRVEYYFADFLSLLEEEDKEKWEIELTETDLRSLPVKLSPEELNELKGCKNSKIDELLKRGYDKNGELKDMDEGEKIALLKLVEQSKNENDEMCKFIVGPRNLIDGRKLKVPQNVWFIGTANRDESTFEITDKVYDRAQVMNFDHAEEPTKRCKPVYERKYISNSYLLDLFEQAKNAYPFNYARNKKIQDIEDCLREEFQVAFGNRMGNQINTFVSVYVAAGQGVRSNQELELEAIDYQIANKVLRKIEYKDASKRERYDYLLACLEDLPMSYNIVDKKREEN